MDNNICLSTLQPGHSTYSPVAIKNLFNGKKTSPFLDLNLETDLNRRQIAENVNRLSVSGVQEKMSAVIDKGKIRLSGPEEQSTHILKPPPLDYDLRARKQIPANEHLTMQIASQVYGIITACNGLCFDAKKRLIYITKRFDVNSDGSKIPLEDFASLCNKNESNQGKNFKYDGFYEDIADAIKVFIPAWPIALERFFRLVVFNYIYGNGDAHLKNFSILRKDGELLLAPAYDLLNTELHIESDDFGLSGGLLKSGWKSDIYEHTGHPCKTDFAEFGKTIGINERRVKTILESFMELPKLTLILLENSFLDHKSKRSYLRILQQRISSFIRQ